MEQAQLKTLSQYVDKARSKLLVEFEEWYRVCYIGGEPIEGTLCEDMDGESEQPETRKVRQNYVQLHRLLCTVGSRK